MEILNTVLPVVINVLLIVLLTVSIILIIKCIYIIDKAKEIMKNVEDKVNSLNGIFSIIKLVNDKVTSAGERIVDFFEGLFMKLFKKKDDDEEYEDE